MNIENILETLEKKGVVVLDKCSKRKRIERYWDDESDTYKYEISWEGAMDGAPFSDDDWEIEDVEGLIADSIEEGYRAK